MATPFKEYLSEKHLSPFFLALKSVHPETDLEKLRSNIFDPSFRDLELKERMRKISSGLGNFLPKDFGSSSQILLDASQEYVSGQEKLVGIELMFLPDFVEIYGLDHFDTSIQRMKEITKIMSCEFAVRPFIIKYADQMMQVMYDWSEDENEHVRRLSSEGSRPRLPWAIALPKFKKDPGPVLPILETLKNDESEYVRRSVANNLNDIAKDHPELALQKGKDWIGQSENTDKLVKHAMRSLLKSNYPGVMELFGYASPEMIKQYDFNVTDNKISVGDKIGFDFRIQNQSKMKSTVRLEYAVHFLLGNGKHSKKVFKISEREMQPGEEISYHRKHDFRPITTRRYYGGKHYVSLITNGKEGEKKPFELKL